MRLALFFAIFLHFPAYSAGKPNLVFFFVDDMGWQDTSVPFHRETTDLNQDYRTPHMEKLAADGIKFTQAYACAICSPSRVSLMTGMNAARHRVTCWTLRKNVSPEGNHPKFRSQNWNLNGLQPTGAGVERSFEAETLPGLLRKAGYRTIHAGKAHFGAKDTPGADPSNLGFDVNIAGSYMGGPGSYHGDRNFSAEWRGGGKIWDIPGLEKYHGQKINLTEAITRESIAAVEQAVADEKPFYLYLSHYAVHAPFEPDRRFIGNYADKDWPKHKKVYASMLESMDRSLGDIRATLKRLGVADQTIIVFMSDNGSPRNNPRNLPLRGHKITGWEGGTRVPLLVHWPQVTKPGTTTDTPVIIEDIFPTFLEMTGTPTPENDGMSFTEVLRNPSTDRSRRPLFWHSPNHYDQPPYSAVRLGDMKLIHWPAKRTVELYDLSSDLGETHDIASKNPERTQFLAKLLTDYLRDETHALMPIDRETGKPVPYPSEILSH
ncbi:sulfatase [Haloferula rosea]|uniref:Sulfatase n=1 Tax=Haloferula rosea TaxID=490093 RepID=A0A934RCQ2_9BACT|nr:sulfatase [Haloferula rosea]MBK1828145.1 sulfatase [Haloferula rosea]